MHVMKSTPDNISGIKEQQQELSKMKQKEKKNRLKRLIELQLTAGKLEAA